MILDHVARYEYLDAELRLITLQLAIPGDLAEDLRNINSKDGVRKDKRDYRDVIGAAERAIIEQTCAREIAQIQYKF